MDVAEDFSNKTDHVEEHSENDNIDDIKMTKSDNDENLDHTASQLEQLKENMIDRISKSNAHFRHQQRDDPDLELKEKAKIASDILNTNIPLFLSRFGSYLLPEDIPYFAEHRNNYEVNFYLREIEKQHDKILNKKIINNRRYAAMQELMSDGDYFSEEEMKWRDPWLYNQMVGQYLSEEDIQAKVDKADLRFSTVLLQHMDQLRENAWFEVLKQKEEGQIEEEEESDEDEENVKAPSKNDKSATDTKPKISEVEKQVLRNEFLQIMQERFMSGQDKTFDYSKVDKNARYDNLDTLGKDEEEKYFDEDDDDVDEDENTPMESNISETENVTEECCAEKACETGSDVDDYMSFPCELSCETQETTEQFTKMAVTNLLTGDSVCCDVVQELPTSGENEMG